MRGRFVLPLVVMAAVVVLVINEVAYYRSRDALDDARTHSVQRAKAANTLRLLVDAETGQRGYMLTGRKEYLKPYEDSVGELRVLLEDLDRFYADDAQAAASAHLLKERGLEKLSELAETIRLFENGQRDAVQSLMLTDIGREKMEVVRQAASALFQIEDDRVTRLRSDLYATFVYNRVGINTITVLGLLALFFYRRQTLALDRSQLRHNEALQLEREQLETRVGHRTAELTDLARHLQAAREDERSHLARELHDELGALLTAAKLDAARLKRSLAPMTPEAAERLTHLNATIDKGISLKRNIIENLRPSSLSNLGLVPALEIQAREFTTRSDVPVLLDLTAVPLSDSAQITVYRLIQESLTNIAKYAEATEIRVSMHDVDGGACVRVRDNGRGFDPSSASIASHGLRGMRYRVESEGGRMRVDSGPGRGALIEAWLPRWIEPDPDSITESASGEIASV